MPDSLAGGRPSARANKFSNYLIYALGEIILVVFGILIALQINNWNEKQKILAEMESNFQNLVEDMESNKLQLQNLIEERTEVSNGGGKLLDNYENQTQVGEIEFIKVIKPILSERYFEINRNGIDKVMSSPAFELREMETIRDLIKSYLRDASILNTFEVKENSAIENMEMITAGNGYFRGVWKSFRNNRYQTTDRYNNPDFDFLEFMENDELLYIIFRYEFVTQFALEDYNGLIERGDRIMEEIEKYRRQGSSVFIGTN